MVTYLVGTDGMPATTAICDFLEDEVGDGDHLEAINVLSSGADADERRDGEAALEPFEEQFGEQTSVTTRQLSRGKDTTAAIIDHGEEIDADRYVMALRRHSRTERIVFGSISHSLMQQVRRPVTLVPLPEYQPEE